jgi:hypothetical protein
VGTKIALSLIALMASVCTGGAATFRLDFTTSNFQGVFGSEPVPTDPVTGTIVWEAGGIREPIQSFDSIHLILDGHTYDVSEIGYVREDFPYAGIELIGGTLNGDGIAESTDDFWVRWDRNSLTPFDFSYSSSQTHGIWTSSMFDPGTFTAFSIVEVPEPGTGVLAVSIVIVVGLRRAIRFARNGSR